MHKRPKRTAVQHSNNGASTESTAPPLPQWPSATDLALIAATEPPAGRTAKQRVHAALDLWMASKRAIDELQNSSLNAICDGLPEPKDFPVPFEEMLRLVMPKKREAERFAVFRMFVQDFLGYPESATGPFIARERANPTDYYQYYYRAFLLTHWLRADLHNQRRRAALLGKKRKLTAEEEQNLAAEARRFRRQSVDRADVQWDSALANAPAEQQERVNSEKKIWWLSAR